MNKKPYLTLKETAEKLERDQEEIIILGAQGNIPIYVLPKGWKADRYTYIDDETADDDPISLPSNPEKLWSTVNNYSQSELLTPVRLHQYTLILLAADPDATTKYFYDSSYTHENAINEYRLNGDAEGNTLEKVSLKTCTLVIMVGDIHKLLNLQSKNKITSEKQEKQVEGKRCQSLLKQIAILSLLLSVKITKYKLGDKPNASKIDEAIQALLEEIGPDLKTHGLKPSSVRGNISKGLKLLNKT
jgi:hypothetical protein